MMRPAYRTRLGNLTAKSVLVLIADQVNAEGFGWPSVDFIVKGTEINKRTVLRVIQIFAEINLLAKIDRGRKLTPGIQLNVERLGLDLSAEFADRFRAAHDRPNGGKRPTDIGESVPRTQKSVPETLESVPRTVPPHPLNGRPANDPLVTHPPTPLQGGACVEPVKPVKVSPARADELRGEELAAVERALAAVMQGCGFTSVRLVPVLRKVILQEADKGRIPARSAAAIMAAWKEFNRQGERLRFKWAASKFFGEGYWKNSESWPWDAQVLREEMQTNAGRLH
jgi:hypothetical protein